jgi:hypothetical protein
LNWFEERWLRIEGWGQEGWILNDMIGGMREEKWDKKDKNNKNDEERGVGVLRGVRTMRDMVREEWNEWSGRRREEEC